MKEKKNLPKAQTMHLGLFGPVFVVSTFHPSSCHVVRRLQYIYNKTAVSINERQMNKRKTYYMAQTTQNTSFGLVFAVSDFHLSHTS